MVVKHRSQLVCSAIHITFRKVFDTYSKVCYLNMFDVILMLFFVYPVVDPYSIEYKQQTYGHITSNNDIC